MLVKGRYKLRTSLMYKEIVNIPYEGCRSARLAPTSCVGRYSLIVVEVTMRRRPGDEMMPGGEGGKDGRA